MSDEELVLLDDCDLLVSCSPEVTEVEGFEVDDFIGEVEVGEDDEAFLDWAL